MEQLPADPRRHRVPLGVFVGLLIGVLAAGGGVVAFGALAKGNPTALLPWAPAPSTPAAVTARTVSLPTPPLPTATLPQPGVRPIIFLPGIAGSYLADGTQELWPNVPGVASTLDCSLSGASPNVATQVQLFSSLALSSDGMPLPGSTVGVANGVEEPVLPAGDSTLGGVFTEESGTADCGAVLNFLAWLGGVKTSGTEYGYAATAANAKASGYVVVQSDDPQGLSVCNGNPRCFVPVGYDWRLSAEANASRVLQIIDQVLTVTGADRVDILAHSQGGLVAAAITKLPQSVGKIYRIVTLGTPYLGAPKALTELLEQTPCEDPNCYLSPAVIQSLIENYPGAMELLPPADYYTAYSAISPSYATVEGEVTQGLAGLTSPATPQNMNLVNAAEQMHASDDAWAPLDPTVGLLRMIGYDANNASPNCDGTYLCEPPQIQIITAPATGDTIINAFNPDGSEASPPVLGDGDGTVPLLSANLYNPANGFDDRGDGRDMYWCGLSHMGLAQDTTVWQSAEAYLEGRTSYSEDALGAYCPDGSMGTIANLGLVLAPPSEPAGAVPPGPAADTSCSPSTATAAPVKTSITLMDDTAGPIDLSWYDPKCAEEEYATVWPQMQLTQDTYVGQMWHLRANGSLVGTIKAAPASQTVVVR